MRKRGIRSKLAMFMACIMMLTAVPANGVLAAELGTVNETEVLEEKAEKESRVAAPVRKGRTVSYDEEIVKIEVTKGPEKTEFLEEYNHILDEIEIKITYANGEIAEDDAFYFCDYDIIDYRCYAKENMKDALDPWGLSAGDYVIRLYAYNGDAYVDYPFKVLSIPEMAKVTLEKDVVSTFAESEEYAVFQYKPDRSGRYVFYPDPNERWDENIYDEEMIELETGRTLNGTGCCVDLEQGKTYYGVFGKETGIKMKVTVSYSGALDGITVRTRKTQFIAGMEYLTSGAIEVDTHYQGKENRLISGDYEDQYGHKAEYILRKDGQEYSMQEPLEVGTYQLTASVVGKPELTDTIEVEATAVDMDQLLLIPENQEVMIQRRDFIQLCSFVPEKDGFYFAEVHRGGYFESDPLVFYTQTETGLAYEEGALKKGERYVFQIPFNIDENKVGLSIMSIRKGGELQLDKTEEVMAVNGRAIFYTFTPKETGYYELTSSPIDPDNSDPWVELYENSKCLDSDDDGGEKNQFSICTELEAGHTYTYQMSSFDEKAKFNILLKKIERSQEGELQLDKTEEVTVVNGGCIPYTFTPKETGYYVLESSSIDSDDLDPLVQLYENGEYLDWDDDGGEKNHFSIGAELEVGHTYTYQVIISEKRTKFNILLRKIEPSPGGELQLDKTEEVTVINGRKISYTFTPEETGYYELGGSPIGSGDSDSWVELYENGEYRNASNDDAGGKYQFSICEKLKAGQTYIYEVVCNNSFSRLNMVLKKLEALKIVDLEFVMDAEEYIEYIDYLDGDELSCDILLRYDDGTSVSEHVWDIFAYFEEDEEYFRDKHGNRVFMCMNLLNETDSIKTYQLKVTAGDITDTQEIVVKKLQGLAKDVLTENGTLMYAASGEEGFSVFKFVPSEEGEYVFYINQNPAEKDLDYGLKYICPEVSTWWDGCCEYENGKYKTMDLKKGKTYYFAVYEPRDYVGSYTITGRRRKEVDSVALITNRTAITPYEFFDWTFSDDFQANVHYTDGTSAIVAMNRQDIYGYNICLGCNKINQKQLEFTVWCKDIAADRGYWDSKALNVDLNHLPEVVVNQRITSPNGGKYKEVYQFTPEESAMYSMIFDCADYEVGLYNADFQDLLSLADGWYLEKGKKYYLTICMDNNGKQSSCVLTKEMHTMGQWVTTREATCVMEGLCVRKCVDEGCEYIETKTIPKTGHIYGSYQITKEPTVLKEGIKTRICSACGHKDTAAIAKLPATISVNAKSIALQVKQSTTALNVTYGKGDAVQSWKSSNNKVVAVNQKGKITGKKTGKATITVTLQSGKSVKIKVSVQKKKVRTKKLKLKKKSLTLKKGEKSKIQVSASPITTQEKITYKSGNKKVASVTSKGIIKARKKGKTYIIVKSGSKSVKYRVTIK